MTIALGGLRDPNPLPAPSAPQTPTKNGEAPPSTSATTSTAAAPVTIIPGMFPREGDRVQLEVFAFAQDEKVTAVKVNVRLLYFSHPTFLTHAISLDCN